LVSPILVRPVREQLEHDRIIRQLQARLRRRFEVGINPGAEQNTPVGTGPSAVYPDLVLSAPGRSRRIEAVVEVETGESVNHLEALAQWAHFSRLRAPFHLYVPAGMVDVARRLSEDNHITLSEIWSYHAIGDEVRFTLVHRSREGPSARAAQPRPSPTARPSAPPTRRGKRPAGRKGSRRAPAQPKAAKKTKRK
jgi:hypothetical protein